MAIFHSPGFCHAPIAIGDALLHLNPRALLSLASMNEGKIQAEDRPMLLAIFQQNWENVRHIKNERLTFASFYAVINVGALSLLNTVRDQGRAEIFLLLFLWFFSLLGLLTSLRLKAELEECLENIDALLITTGLESFMAMGVTRKERVRYPKFRWMFPTFYTFTTTTFTALLLYNLFVGRVP